MKRRSKVHLSLIPNEATRKATFNKRKKGLFKKLNQLATLCDIKACAVVYSPFDGTREAWPSKEGVEEVVSNFMEVPISERGKRMVDQETYTWERINKAKERVKKLQDENREHELKEVMFGMLNGKPMEHCFDERNVREMGSFIDHYLNRLTRRSEILMKVGESSSLAPPLLLPPAPFVGVDVAAVTTPNEVGYGHIQFQNANGNELVQYHAPAGFYGQQEPVQHQAPANGYSHVQHLNMIHKQEPIQYQAPANFNGHIQYHNMNPQGPVQYQGLVSSNGHISYNMNLNQDANMGLVRDLSMNSNAYPNGQQSFMGLLMGQQPQQMGYVGGQQASIPFMNGNHQQQTGHELAVVNDMFSMTTTDEGAAGFGPNINNNNPWSNMNGF
ncbi:unnamed protein product [Cochlearia groenlandica]